MVKKKWGGELPAIGMTKKQWAAFVKRMNRVRRT